MNKLVTELALLSQNEQEKIKEGLQNQIEHKAKLKMETAPEDYLQYLEDEIENAKNALDVLADESTRVGAILPTISFNYVWNKERLNTLKRLRQEWESRPDPAVPEPQQEQTKPTRGKGRPTEPFASKMINDTDGEKLKKMHTILKGKRGKDFALMIWACEKKGWCNKPTYTQVRKEFGDIGSSTGYNRYVNNINIMFTQEEKDGALKSLD